MSAVRKWLPSKTWLLTDGQMQAKGEKGHLSHLLVNPPPFPQCQCSAVSFFFPYNPPLTSSSCASITNSLFFRLLGHSPLPFCLWMYAYYSGYKKKVMLGKGWRLIRMKAKL